MNPLAVPFCLGCENRYQANKTSSGYAAILWQFSPGRRFSGILAAFFEIASAIISCRILTPTWCFRVYDSVKREIEPMIDIAKAIFDTTNELGRLLHDRNIDDLDDEDFATAITIISDPFLE